MHLTLNTIPFLYLDGVVQVSKSRGIFAWAVLVNNRVRPFGMLRIVGIKKGHNFNVVDPRL